MHRKSPCHRGCSVVAVWKAILALVATGIGLKGFRITPENIRIGGKVPKGYYRRQFQEAWDPPVERCDHCGQPGDLYPAAYGAADALLHPGCRDAWVAAQDDLSIPPYLDRRGAVA